VVIALLAFAWITVGLRCYTMGCMMKRFFAEDWIAVVTLVSYQIFFFHLECGNLPACIGTLHRILSLRLGRHPLRTRSTCRRRPTEYHSKALLFKWLGQVSYVMIAVLVKFIVGLFLLRICSHQRWQRITIYALLTIVALFNAFYIIIVILQCIPVESYWFRYSFNSPVHGKCSKSKLAVLPTYISLMLNVLSDFTLASLPVSFVWNSKMYLKTKVSVVGVLALGSM
jgi:hypothetical protein